MVPQKQESHNPAEFRPYRRALVVLYFVVGGILVLLLLGSIAKELFLRPGQRPPRPSPADLLECNRDVRRLLESLGDQAAQLQLDAIHGAGGDLGGRWEAFTRSWQENWDRVNNRCGFDLLADTGQGVAYDRMAWVHRNLATTRLKYREMMARFSQGLAHELAEMRRALARSLADLEKRARLHH